MGLSLRAYSRHRRVTLAAVQKALKTNRITALPDGTIDPEAADTAWNAAAEVRRAAKKVPPDPTRVLLPERSLAVADATVRAVLAEHRTPAGKGLTLADARLAQAPARGVGRADGVRGWARSRSVFDGGGSGIWSAPHPSPQGRRGRGFAPLVLRLSVPAGGVVVLPEVRVE